MKITTISQVQEILNQPLEVVAKGVYNVPGWPTVAMNRASLLKWANGVGSEALAMVAEASHAILMVKAARAQYRRKAQARSQAQAARFAAMLVA